MTDTTTPAAPKAPWWKNKWVWIVTVIILIGIGANANKKKDSEKAASETTTTTSTTSKAAADDSSGTSVADADNPTATAAPKVGDTVKVGDYKYTIHGVSDPYSPQASINQAREGFRIVQLDISVENATSEAKTFSGLLVFTIKDRENQKWSMSLFSDPPTLEGSLNAGDVTRGNAAFEIPVTSTGLKLAISPGFGSGDTAYIPLS